MHVPAPLLHGPRLIDHIFFCFLVYATLFYSSAVQSGNSVNILICAPSQPRERYQQDYPVTLHSYLNRAYICVLLSSRRNNVIILKRCAPHRNRTRGDHPEYRFSIYPRPHFSAVRFFIALPRPVNYATHFLSPNKTQFPPLRLTIYKYQRSRLLERSDVKIFSHPTIQVGSHSFILPYCMLMFALKTP